jgi:hypothetical protein
LTKLRRRYSSTAIAMSLSASRLTAHLATMFVQERDDTAVAEVIVTAELGGRGAIPVGLNQFGDCPGGQSSDYPLQLRKWFSGSDLRYADFSAKSTIE